MKTTNLIPAAFKNLKSLKLFGILFLLLLNSCYQERAISPDYEIYSKILSSSFKAKYLFVAKQTSSLMVNDFDYESLLKRFPTLEMDTFEDLKEKAKTTDTLDYHFITNKKVILSKSSESFKDTYESQKDYIGKAYSKIKTQGITTFSSVGFNRTFTQAIVFDWTQSGPLSGAGYISLFELKHKRWKLFATSLYGIS